MANIRLKNLRKKYASSEVIHGINLEIKHGEFVVLVGPSGCGKSTTLRMIAGLEEISSGMIQIDSKTVNHIAPKDRDIAMVFQNYALYPHMSVKENMAFSLRLKKTPRPERENRVRQAAQMLGIEDLLDRQPGQLSGGQRQRVAMGRALVRNPKVFLFDEPLSNLDAKLRAQMRTEIKSLHQKLQCTIVYVTHDQTEAMTLADRIVVMKEGRISQVGTPQELYESPLNTFVAGFIGNPAMSFLNARLENDSILLNEKHDFKLDFAKNKETTSQKIILGIRPENVKISPSKTSDSSLHIPAKVDLLEPLGAETLIHCSIGGQKIISRQKGYFNDKNTSIYLSIEKSKIHVFDQKKLSIFEKN